jgi:hypothetical protein
MATKIRTIVFAAVVLLLVGSFAGSVEARGGTFVISPCDEAIEKIQLTPPDNVVGNMTANNGFVYFFVTNPSYDIVYQSLKTSFESFNITANESGTYVMHFVNKYQSGDVNVTLSYGLNVFVNLSETIHVSTQITSNTVTITPVQRFLHLDIVPSAFPVAGDFWKISVFYQNQSYYSPLPNATVEVTIIVGNQTKVYSITSDEFGHTEFQFLPEYSDISFQAIYGGNKSDIIALTQRSEHYVRADFVQLMFQSSIVLSGITAVSEAIMLRFRKRIKVIFNLLIGVIFVYSLIQLVISIYAQVNLWTPWGYPTSIFGLVTWTFLGYVSLVLVILSAILNVLAYLFRLRSPIQVVPLK